MNTYSTRVDHKVRWSFLYHDGKPFPINDFILSVRIDTGRGSIFVENSELTFGSNYIEFNIPATEQVSGVYSLKAAVYKGQTFSTEFMQPEAFMLSPVSSSTVATIDVVSYAEPIFSATREAEQAAKDVQGWIADNDIIPRFVHAVVDEEGEASYYTNVIRLTKTQYDAITTKGSTTLYVIINNNSIDDIYIGVDKINLGKSQIENAINIATNAQNTIASTKATAEESLRKTTAAETAATNAQTYASNVATFYNQLLQAIQDLPDGQAVSEQVAENTANITILNALITSLKTDIMNNLKFKVLSEAEFNTLVDEGRVDSGTIYFRLEEMS